MKSPKDIETRILNTQVKPRPEMRGKVLADALAHQQEQNQAGVSAKPWRIIMKSRTTKWATAAILLIGVMVGMYLSGGSLDGAAVAWADVIGEMQNHERYKCRMRAVREKGPEIPAMLVYHLNLSQRRQVLENGHIHVIDMRGEDTIMVELHPATKKATVVKALGRGATKDPDIIDMVKRFEADATERLGTKDQDGRTLYGFRHQPDEHNEYTVWVDGESKLPVEIEIKHLQAGQTIFMDEFEFDFELDPLAFSTDVPEGYEVETLVTDYRPVEPEQITSEDLRGALIHSAYAVKELPWMKKVITVKTLDSLATRTIIYMTGILSNNGNTIVLVQGDFYDAERMVWLPDQRLVLETDDGAKVYTHLNGSDYARCHLKYLGEAEPDFFNTEEIGKQRSTRMILLPSGTVIGVAASKEVSSQRLTELVESLTELAAE